jgi:hypothetical protein
MYFGKMVTSSWEKLIVFNTFFLPFLFYAWFLLFPLNIPKWNWDVSTYVNIKVIISQFNLGGLFLEDEKRIFLLLEKNSWRHSWITLVVGRLNHQQWSFLVFIHACTKKLNETKDFDGFNPHTIWTSTHTLMLKMVTNNFENKNFMRLTRSLDMHSNKIYFYFYFPFEFWGDGLGEGRCVFQSNSQRVTQVFPKTFPITPQSTCAYHMCHNLMLSWNFNKMYVTINITYCTFVID